jgi:hypothetical protein
MKDFFRPATYVPFRRFLGDVRREFMQRLSSIFHGTLGSYLRDGLQEGSVAACLMPPGHRYVWSFLYFFVIFHCFSCN